MRRLPALDEDVPRTSYVFRDANGRKYILAQAGDTPVVSLMVAAWNAVYPQEFIGTPMIDYDLTHVENVEELLEEAYKECRQRRMPWHISFYKLIHEKLAKNCQLKLPFGMTDDDTCTVAPPSDIHQAWRVHVQARRSNAGPVGPGDR